MAQMISIKVGTNTSRKTVVVDDATIVRDVFTAEKIDYSTATVYLDGAPLGAGDMGKSLKDVGATADAMLIAVVKANNA